MFEGEKKSVDCAICIFVAWANVRFCPREYLVLLFWLLFVRGEEVGVGNSMVDRAICLLIL